MSQTRKPRGVRATKAGRQKLVQAKASRRNNKGKPWTYFDVATAAEVDEKTVQRFFRGEAKDRNYAIAIVQALDLDITEVVDPQDWNPPEETADAINWREVCGKVLAQQREKQNFRRAITGRHLGHEAKNVYVKLGLVKPKEQPRRGDEFQPSADRGMLQYQLTEKEIEQEYQYDEFLEQVIEGKEKNLTIVGEPGAGKSTWLEQIALYVDNSNKGFPICISLGSLGGKTLEEYLFQIWLKNALRISQCDVGITSAQKKLEELFQSGKVWLLLDGVDEMRAEESPLQAIVTQLEGWGDLARVVLTCRSNVWEANPNALLNFETYRTLHFDDEQVGDFIQQWFTQESKPTSGEELETKLDEARNDRIRDLIKNPLRLAMLCGIWYFHQGDLPKTKATLYQQYIEYFYLWKQHPQLSNDLDKQEELHAALSKLALEAIDKKLPVRRKFAHKVMGKSLFQLARDVGWLNWVYKDAETGEDVYAFFHLTFQEYFAACAIDDWRKDFFNHVPENPMQGTYRIFEPQWKEVILLWLGRNEGVKKKQKEEFIQALVEFEDGFQNLYWFQAYFLAAAGIVELDGCSYADAIVKQIVQWAFGYFDRTKQTWMSFSPLDYKARALLPETLRSQVITELTELLHTCQDEKIRRKVAEKNGKTFDEIIIGQVALTLLELSRDNLEATKALSELINNSHDDFVPPFFLKNLEFKAQVEILRRYVFLNSQPQQRPAASWKEDKIGSPRDIIDLIDFINTTDVNPLQLDAMSRLEKIVTGNPEAISPVIAVMKRSLRSNLETDRYPLFKALECMQKIGVGSPEAISLLFEVVYSDSDYGNYAIKDNAIWALIAIGAGNQDVFNFLMKLVHNENGWGVSVGAVRGLVKIVRGDLFRSTVTHLKGYLQDSICKNNRVFYVNCYWTLWHCAQNLPYPDFYQAWNQTTIQ